MNRVFIPVIDIPPGMNPGGVSARCEPERLDMLVRSARRMYTPIGVRIADNMSKRFSAGMTSPYRHEVEEVDEIMGRPGAFLLNYSYEWGCTSGVTQDAWQGGMTLLRTLDWPFNGLGKALIVTMAKPAAGLYASITWPGMVGVMTGVAPGRFAIAINQPPLPFSMFGRVGGWITNRWRVNHARAIPPGHLLRMVFEMCKTFDEAVNMLSRIPICLPVIFTVAGPEPGQAVVLERFEDLTIPLTKPVAANHWVSPFKGNPRNKSSRDRYLAMEDAIRDGISGPRGSLDWVREPILCSDTRLAATLNPKSGQIIVQGWEKDGPVTEILRHQVWG